ncbi:MAG: NADH-quinone oxidoreductase subunit M [Candidatus Electryoneaceae bacterium]|nr:NADH-quinone oxidoreductase subunit M [Candidatus Electryoneaceae bacterium]
MGPLTLITFLPAVGAAVIALLPKDNHKLIQRTALVFTFVVLVITISLYPNFDTGKIGINDPDTFQFVEGPHSWISMFNISYYVGIDGLSFPMILLTGLLCFLCIPASFGIKKGVKGYFAMFLLLETGMMGTFVALDFFLFYVFWEIMLLPMYFLIGIWGGPRRVYAAIKFFIYTLIGSVLMLIVMLVFYFNVTDPETGQNTFNMLIMMNQANQGGIMLVDSFRALLFFGLYIGFAIKIPAFPFHTWLPDAHVEAPTAVSVILAGVLLKMGTYGLLRITYPILPNTTLHFAWFIALIGVINIIYGAFCAMAQKDLKKLVAYSSISHMGFVMLAMASFTPAGMNGAVLQMFNHGTITAMLFLLVGVVYDRAHHREIAGFGGLANIMPRYLGVFALAFFASLGLPGLSGFISEAMCFIGAFPVWRTFTIIAVGGMIITASYLLWTMQRIFFGETNPKYNTGNMPDLNARELFTLVPLGVIVLVMGVWPHPIMGLMNTSMTYLGKLVQTAVSL